MQRLTAPAKLTLSLRVVDVRADGYHLLDAEMVSLDLADELEFSAGGGLELVDETVGGGGIGALAAGRANLVTRALEVVGRSAAVRLLKRIPLGAGLGGGSSDAAAVLRWAGCRDLSLGVALGADVPFCMVGGRARVRGIGEVVDVLPFEERRFLLLVPPLAVDTAAVYRAFDAGERLGPGDEDGGNDLEAAAMAVVPALRRWRRALEGACCRRPRLAGSGAAWFVEDPDGGLADQMGGQLAVGPWSAPVLSVRTVPPFGGDGAVAWPEPGEEPATGD